MVNLSPKFCRLPAYLAAYNCRLAHLAAKSGGPPLGGGRFPHRRVGFAPQGEDQQQPHPPQPLLQSQPLFPLHPPP